VKTSIATVCFDANETDVNGNGTLDPGLFEYVTVYSREPNFHSDGSSLTNVNLATETRLQTLFQSADVGNASGLATSIYNYTHPRNGRPNTFPGVLSFCLFCRNLGMSSGDFSKDLLQCHHHHQSLHQRLAEHQYRQRHRDDGVVYGPRC